MTTQLDEMELAVVADWADENSRPTVAAILRDVAGREPYPFQTGSRAYGTPRTDSDYDIVAFMTTGEIAYLGEKVRERSVSGTHTSLSLRLGPFNVICLTRRFEFNAWQDATNELTARKPVARSEAIELIKSKCKDIGIDEKELRR